MAHPLRKLVAMSTVGLLFVGGVAAAAAGTNPLSPLLGASEDAGPSLTTTTTTTTIGTTTTTTTASADAAALDDEVVCPEGVANHGEAVSEVAKDDSTVGAEHGAAVSAMAKSDCGKTDDDEVAPESESTDDEVVCPEGVKNHGEAVSEVAHDKSTVGAEHGAAVSAMAKSDCGKTEGPDAADDENEERAAHQSAGKSNKNKAHHNDDGDNDAGGELGS